MRMLYVWSYVEHSAVVLQGSGYWWWRGGTICYGFLFVFVYSMLECNAADVLIVAGTKGQEGEGCGNNNHACKASERSTTTMHLENKITRYNYSLEDGSCIRSYLAIKIHLSLALSSR